MTVLKLLLLALAGLSWLGMAHPADKPAHGFLHRTYKDPDGKTAKYLLFVPPGYKGDKAYPLILFLHGRGETGTDGNRQSQVGLGPAIRKHEKSFGFITI